MGDVCCLYRLTSPSGKQYIGMTNNFNRRMRCHKHAENGEGGFFVQKAIRKYGMDNFVVEILVYGTRQYICELEKRAIISFNTKVPNGYNLSEGGEGNSLKGELHPLYSKKGSEHPAFGSKRTEEFKENVSRFMKGNQYAVESGGRNFSEEDRKNISARMKGNRNFESRCFTDEYRQKLSEAASARKYSEEERFKLSRAMSERMQQKFGTTGEKYLLSDGRVFNSAKECADAIGAHQANVRHVAIGKRKSTMGFAITLIKE